MKKSVWLWEFFGFALVSLLGTVLHFLYEWTGESVWVAAFSGVNESTFEHMKLLFWPMFFFTVFQSFFFRECGDFWCVKLHGTLLGIILIPVLFYTYNGVIGTSPDFINIAIFFVAAAVSFFYETQAFTTERAERKMPMLCFGLLIAIGLLFVLFTFKTPEIGIFRDPLTGGYGI